MVKLHFYNFIIIFSQFLGKKNIRLNVVDDQIQSSGESSWLLSHSINDAMMNIWETPAKTKKLGNLFWPNAEQLHAACCGSGTKLDTELHEVLNTI